MSAEVPSGRPEGVSVVAALTGVPRLSVEQWQATGATVRWLIVARASVLIMTFCSVALGGLLAASAGHFDAGVWLLCVLGSLLAHATNNQLNDLVDSQRGIDAGNYFRMQYGTHALAEGLISRNALLRHFAATGISALLIGGLIAWLAGPAVLAPMAAGAVLLLFYTYPLKQLGLGEVAVLLVWGPLLTGGTYLASTGIWSWNAALIATVYALGPTAVIFGKHLDKLDFDAAKGVRTMPVRLGPGASRGTMIAMLALQYLGVICLVVTARAPWSLLAVLLALPAAFRLARVLQREPPAVCPDDYPENIWPLWYTAFAFAHTRNFGLLLLLGLLAAWLPVS